MDRIYGWWWFIFVVIYPLIFVPSERGFWGSNYAYHVIFTTFFVLGATLFEWFLHPHLRLSDVRYLPKTIWQHKPVLLALLFGIWGILAAFFAPSPITALMGSLARNGDSALVSLLFSFVFVLIYIQAQRDKKVLIRISVGVVVSGVLLGLGALLEVALGKGLIYAPSPADLPIVSFPQKGHLAGYLLATFGVTFAFWLRKPSWLLLAVLFLLSISLGLTYNRAAFVAIAVLIMLGFWRVPKLGIVAMLVVGLGLIGGIQWTQIRGVGGQKDLASVGSMQARLLFWKAAVRGVLERPIVGWGGGNFDYYWPKFLSPDEQEKFLRLETGTHKMIEYVSSPGTIPVWVVENAEGLRYTQSILLWKSHNQFLEVALQRGLVGLGLYMALLLFSFFAFVRINPGATGLWAYHIFLMLWFIPYFSEGVMWALFAIAARESMHKSDRKKLGS